MIVRKPEGLPPERPETIEYITDPARAETVFEYLCQTAEAIRCRKHNIFRLEMGTADIETTTIPEDGKKRPWAFAYLVQFRAGGINWIFRTLEDFNAFLERAARILAMHDRTLVVYVHNLSFEYQFFRGFLPIDYSSVFALQSRRVAKFYSHNGAFEWRCSYLLSNMSLEKFTKNYCPEEFRKDKELIDYEVIRYPWDPVSDEILYYGLMDVITLEAAIVAIMEKEGDDLKTIPMTNTGYVRRSCRTACIGENWKHYDSPEEKASYKKFRNYRRGFDKMKLTLEQYNLLRDAFRGGNTHANRFAAGRVLPDPEDDENPGHADFTSEYPAQLICSDEFPMGKLMDCTGDLRSIDDIDEYCGRYWMLIKIAIVNPDIKNKYRTKCPYIPAAKIVTERKKEWGIYDNGRMLKQEGVVWYTFLGVEWPLIKRQLAGNDIAVVKAYYTIKGYLPDALRGTVYEWFAKKTTLKGVPGAEYEYMKSKNRVNSCYGMMVEAIIKDIMEVKDDGTIESRAPTLEEQQNQLEEFYKYRNAKFLAYQWGVTITALARVEHMRLIEMLGPDFIYGDTDSVFFLHPSRHWPEIEDYNRKWEKYAAGCGIPISAVTQDGVTSTLGVATHEPDAEKFITLGAKKYATVTDGKLEITVAGVPKEAGAALLGDIKNFKPGFTFYVGSEADLKDRQNWKKTLHYRDDLKGIIEIAGHRLALGPCIAITRAPYVLNVSDDYSKITGIPRWKAETEAEEIYEQDDVWS